MRVYHTLNLGEDCNISGVSDGLPLKTARAMTNKLLPDERLHYHLTGYEYYLIIKGVLRIRVGDKTLEARTGDMVVAEPKEPHRIEAILEDADYFVVNTNPDPLDKIVLE